MRHHRHVRPVRRPAWRLPACAGMLVALASGGCRYSLPDEAPHAFAFARDGLPVEYHLDEDRAAAAATYAEHLALAARGLHEFDAAVRAAGHDPGVLIYLHGGLNTPEAAYARVARRSAEAKREHLYPVFVCWHSGLVSSYWDHLFRVRQGQDRGALGVLGSPLFLVADVARSVLRAPFVWGSQFQDAVAGDREEVLACLERCAPPRDCRTALDVAGAWTRFALTSPTKLAGSLFVDGFGTSSWEMMLRRTRLLFSPDDVANGGEFSTPVAPFVELLRRIAGHVQHERDLSSGPRNDVLVAHSMGAIIANDLLRLATVDPRAFPSFRHVVYMAPACSVSDFIAAAIPYLRSHHDARITLLLLHPIAENNEANAFDIGPRGSLLTWIDRFLARPLTMQSRMLGRAENLVRALPLLPDDCVQRGQIEIRICSLACDDGDPQEHGDFEDFLFERLTLRSLLSTGTKLDITHARQIESLRQQQDAG